MAGRGSCRTFADGAAGHQLDERKLTVPLRRWSPPFEIVRALDAAGVDAVDVQRREPTLDDVFLTLVGQTQTTAVESPQEVPA